MNRTPASKRHGLDGRAMAKSDLRSEVVRRGSRVGRLKTAAGVVEYTAPQISDRAVPFRARLCEIIRDQTEELEALAVEMYARGLSTRDIEALLADARAQSLVSRTA